MNIQYIYFPVRDFPYFLPRCFQSHLQQLQIFYIWERVKLFDNALKKKGDIMSGSDLKAFSEINGKKSNWFVGNPHLNKQMI